MATTAFAPGYLGYPNYNKKCKVKSDENFKKNEEISIDTTVSSIGYRDNALSYDAGSTVKSAINDVEEDVEKLKEEVSNIKNTKKKIKRIRISFS